LPASPRHSWLLIFIIAIIIFFTLLFSLFARQLSLLADIAALPP